MQILIYLLLVGRFVIVCQGIPANTDSDQDYPIYPFQQYVQVRKSYSVEHLPIYAGETSNPSGNLESAASSHSNSGSDSGSEGGHYNYQQPRLSEEIQTYKKQEVYEEKGFSDSDYDHYNTGGGLQNHNNHESQPTRILPQYKTLAENDGSSSNLLLHAATVLYDRDAHKRGIYNARSGIYCPEVIDFEMSSKSMKMGKGQERLAGKPRLSGLGSKIQCLRRKYFGENPFPSTIFKHPDESKDTPIKVGSMTDFMKDFHQNINIRSNF